MLGVESGLVLLVDLVPDLLIDVVAEDDPISVDTFLNFVILLPRQLKINLCQRFNLTDFVPRLLIFLLDTCASHSCSFLETKFLAFLIEQVLLRLATVRLREVLVVLVRFDVVQLASADGSVRRLASGEELRMRLDLPAQVHPQVLVF